MALSGINFAVWAPNCYKVAVVGDFNHWDPRAHPMEANGDSGIWELFVPGLKTGSNYKYEIRSHHDGYRAEKADPYAFFAEMRPKTASVAYDIEGYDWQDAAWMSARESLDQLSRPMNIYEAHLGSWKRGADDSYLSYRDLAERPGSLSRRHGIHAPGVAAGRRTSAGRVLGLPSHRLLRAKQPLRYANRFHALWWTLATNPASP